MRCAILLAAATCCLTFDSRVVPEDNAGTPLTIKFLDGCQLPKGHRQVYDPDTGVFHVHFQGQGRCGFRVERVTEATTKPVVFHLTGLPDLYGFDPGVPLTLAIDGKNYLIDIKRAPGGSSYNLILEGSLFRVESKFVTDYTYHNPIRLIELTIEFTEKGKRLLKPGTQIFCVKGSYW